MLLAFVWILFGDYAALLKQIFQISNGYTIYVTENVCKREKEGIWKQTIKQTNPCNILASSQMMTFVPSGRTDTVRCLPQVMYIHSVRRVCTASNHGLQYNDVFTFYSALSSYKARS